MERRRQFFHLLAVTLVWAAGLTWTTQQVWGQGATTPRGLQIYWIDVEGGAATLLITPAGESILIDTGNPGPRDAGRIVKVLTDRAKVGRIDHLIITHYHSDHFGGAATLAKMVPIGTRYDNGYGPEITEKPDAAYRELPRQADRVIQPGDVWQLKQVPDSPPLKITCLGTRQQFIAPQPGQAESAICHEFRAKDRDGSDNANSVVLKIEYGPFVFLDAGDLTWNQEVRLVCPHDLIGPIDVYQVTHHGLDASNNPLVLKVTQPTIAVMNNGVTKGCAPEVFANLREIKSIQALYQVHRNERPDGDVNNAPAEYIANPQAACDGEPIHLEVSPDGQRYTVQVTSTGHARTYETRQKN